MAGEQFAFVLVKEVTGKLSSGLWKELALHWDFKQDLEDIVETLVALEAVSKDAEGRSMKDEAVNLWLKRLKAAAYDIKDMLNNFEIRKEVSNNTPMGTMTVRRFFSSSNPLISRATVAHKMRKMRKRLRRIAEKKSIYSLKVETPSDKQEEIEMRETSFTVDTTTIIGREKEKQNIIKQLLATQNQAEVSVISIVGMGGLGKTTLARLIFNDTSTNIFNPKIWIHAMEFDAKKLAKAIIISSGSGQRCDFDNLQSSIICIKNLLRGKRYLIVFDDVWNDEVEKWNVAKEMLQGGDGRSRILVTTRNQQVALMMDSGSLHNLKYLSDNDCWKLFEQRAFGPGHVKSRPILEKIGKEIVKKCGGVPLVANALGGILCLKDGEEAWKEVRDNPTWEIEQQYENKILASLKVSYQYMPIELKLCFLYCSIYPKSFELDKDKLIQQWIAQGFIQSKQESMSLDIGNKYINNLLAISFLQDRKMYHEKNRRVTYKMHDLVYDLARSIAGNEVLVMEAGKEATTNVQECRYASLSGYGDSSELQKALPKNARALHFRGCVLFSLPDNVFSRTRCVRVLDLNGCFIDELPTSISQLKQLRYLDASHGPVDNLDAIVKFQNLEMLNLLDCPINQVPSTIRLLKKLYFLNLSGCSNISTLPSSIGELHRLLYLDLSGCHQLRELPEPFSSLKNLSSLNLGGCSSLQTLDQSIGNLESLRFLDLSHCALLKALPESISKLLNLQLLDLSDCTSLFGLPQSIGNLTNLQTLILRSCQLIEVLPETLSNLINLETLDLRYCTALNHLHQSIGNLESLKFLDLSQCDGLRELPESVGNLQNLRTLILGQHELRVLPETLSNLVNLEILDLQMCWELHHMPSKIGRLSKLRALSTFIVDDIVVEGYRSRGCNIAELEHLKLLTGDLFINFKCGVDPDDAKRANLKEKEIQSLTLFWSSVDGQSSDHAAILQHLVPHQNLKILKIIGFLGVNSPTWMMKEMEKFVPNLIEIELSFMLNCDCVPVLGQLPYLRKIELRSMPEIRSISTQELCGGDRATSFRSLEELVLWGMPNLEEWVMEDDSYNGGGGGSCCFFPYLRRLDIVECPRLRIRPRIPPSVMMLTLNRCSKALEESAEVNTWKKARPNHLLLCK